MTEFRITQGDTLRLPVQFRTGSDGGPVVDVTGWTFRAHVRRGPGSPLAFALSVTVIDAVTGRIELSGSSFQTAALLADDCGYQFDLEATDALGSVSHPLDGHLIVDARVTA